MACWGGSRSYFPSDYDSTSARAIRHNKKYVGFKEGYLTDVLADSTISFIKRNNDQPFFAFLSFTAVHTPMQATEEDMARFEGHTRQKLAAMTWAMDRAVGNIIRSLEESGQLENTLIFFLSDNGGARFNDSRNTPLKGQKGNKFEGGLRVPFFVYWKGKFRAGQTIDGLTSSLDIMPTSLAAAGIKKTDGKALDGVNLLPYLNGEKQGAPHQKLYFRKERSAAMREGKWKMIKLDDYGYVMYDLKENLGETKDLSEVNPEQFKSMKSDLRQWEQGLVDPWWHESKQWREVTWEIHKALMQNKKPERVRP